VRTLGPSPPRFLDATGRPAFGSYAGPLPAVVQPSRWTRDKRWVFLALASDEVWISLAVVRTGYAATVFGYVLDRAAGRLVVDRTAVAPAAAATVTADFQAPGLLAGFRFLGTRIALERRDGGLVLDARFGAAAVEATLDPSAAPPPICAIAELAPGRTSGTEKRALTSVRGFATVGARRFALDGALGGVDYTHGAMPRRTRWRWAFGMGRRAGSEREPIGFNLCAGFVGEAECALFTGRGARGRVEPLGEPAIRFDAGPAGTWGLEGEGVDLEFTPAAIHEQRTQLLVVRSRFLQPVGVFRGRVGGVDLGAAGIPGVVEDQDVVW
jgi:hypothetical protein